MNPYESPHSDCDPPPRNPVEPPLRGQWLVSVSLVLLILSIMPIIDLLAMSQLKGAGFLYFLTHVGYVLAISLMPLVFYLCINGRRGLKAAKGRITAIGIIVGLMLLSNILWILSSP